MSDNGGQKFAGGGVDHGPFDTPSATFKQRFPRSALSGLGVPDEGPSIDSAFSNVNDEFPLGNALRNKAGK